MEKQKAESQYEESTAQASQKPDDTETVSERLEEAGPKSVNTGNYFGIVELLIAAVIGGIILTGYNYWTDETAQPPKIFTTNARSVIDLAYYTALTDRSTNVDHVKDLVGSMKKHLEIITQSGGVVLNERYVISGGEKIIFDKKGIRVKEDLQKTANQIDRELNQMKKKYPGITGIVDAFN